MQVDVQDVGLVEFPDDATDQEIQDALNELFPVQQPSRELPAALEQKPLETGMQTIQGLNIPQTALPYNIPSSIIPDIDWQRAQQLESEPWRAGLQEGVPTAAGITPAIVPQGRRITEAITGIPQEAAEVLRQEVPALRALDVPTTVAASVAKAGIGLTDYLSSPQGVTELVLSMTPAKLLVLGKWAYDMASGAYTAGAELGKLLAKEDKTPEDYQQISDHTINALALGLGAGFTGKKAVTTGIADVKTIAKKLNMPEGKIKLEDRGPVAQEIFNRFVTERQIQAGSPFVRAEAPTQPISMGVRTQPPLSMEFDPQGRLISETFEPSGLSLAPELQPGVRGLGIPEELQSPAAQLPSPSVSPVAPLRAELPTRAVSEKTLSTDEARRLIFETAVPTITSQGTKLSSVVPVSEIESLSAGLADAQSLLAPGELGVSIRKIQFPNRPINRGPTIPKALGDLFNRESIFDKTGENIDVNRARVVMPMMLRAIEKPQVFNSIIKSIPIDMVNMLSSEKFPADKILHDPAMFVEALTSNPNPLVPLRFLGYLNGLHLLDKTIQSKPSQVYAIYKTTKEILRNVRQPEVTPEGKVQMPVSEGGPKAPETLEPTAPVTEAPTEAIGYTLYEKIDPTAPKGKRYIVAAPDEYGIKLTAKQGKWKKVGSNLTRTEAFQKQQERNQKAGIKQEVQQTLYIKEGSTLTQVTPEQASIAMSQIRDRSGLGSSKLGDLILYDINGKPIAFVSYNGNVWLGTPNKRAIGKESLLHNATGLEWDAASSTFDIPKPKGWDQLTEVQDALDAIRKKNKNKSDAALAVSNKEFGSLILKRDQLIDAAYAISKPTDIISKLEDLKFPETGEGRVYSLPHPDAVRQIGRQVWNDAVDLAIAAIKAGKTVAEAIDSAFAHVKGKATGTFDEAKIRSNLEFVARTESGAERPTPVAGEPPKVTPPTPTEPQSIPTDPITGEPAKLITEKEARAMERKVKIPAQADVETLANQIDLFNREIGDALESGGQFLPKELRPEVAKGAPAEKGTVTNKQINQYFVNKLSSIRKDMIAAGNKIKQQADIESQVYFDLIQKRFEQAFRQVQELRRTSHESLYFWNKIKAEYQAIAQAAGAMPEMKRWVPVFDSMARDLRLGKREQVLRTYAEFLRLNQFTPGSWTLDFGTNLAVAATRLPAWAIMDIGAFITGRPPLRMATAVRALADNMRNWNPLGKRFRLPDKLEMELGNTIGGEFGGKGREIFFDFSEILKGHPEAAERLRHLDKVATAPVRMKRAVDGFFGRFGAAAELYHRAYIDGKTRGLKGDDLKTFVEEFVRNPPDMALERAIKAGKEFKFNRDLMPFEERFANSLGIKLFVETYPRWTLQFIRWAGEMTGLDPVFAKKLLTGKATGEEGIKYLTKAATGWGGIYAFNQLFYDNVDANSMEYVKEDGNRIRLSGRTPVPEIYFVCALLRGDTVNAKAALPHLSLPLAKVLGGEPGGLLSPFIKTFSESLRGNYTVEQTARELNALVNNMIPGKTILGLIRAFFDPTIREGIGSPIPGVSSLLPQPVDPTTGEPRAPKQRIPGTKIEIPTVAGTPFPGAERVLNDVESALLEHGFGLTRPRRTSIIDLPAEDVPKEVRREYEKFVGQNIKEFIGEEIKLKEFQELPFEIRREILSQLMTEARQLARIDIAEKYGTSIEPVESVPLNIQRMPKRLRQ